MAILLLGDRGYVLRRRLKRLWIKGDFLKFYVNWRLRYESGLFAGEINYF